MFNDVYAVGIVRELVRWVEQCPRATAEFHRRNASGWHGWQNCEFKRWLLAYCQQADITTPRGRRLLRRCMDEPLLTSYFSDEDRWRVSEDEPVTEEPNFGVTEPEVSVRRIAGLTKSLKWFAQAPAKDDDSYLGRALAGCINPPHAVRLLADCFPLLKNEQDGFGYLTAIGYACGVPTPAVRRAMARLGWAENEDASEVTAGEFHDIIARLKTGTSYSHSALSLLMTILVNDEPWRCYTVAGPCCGKTPQCGMCVLNGACSYSKRPLPQPQTVRAEPGEALSTDVGPVEVSRMIGEMDVSDRPREKLIRKGVDTLRDEELLAIILRVGCQGCSVIDLSKKIIKEFGGLHRTLSAGVQELSAVHGLGEAKAAQVIAALEIGKRAFKQAVEHQYADLPLTDARAVYEAYRQVLYDAKQEMFIAIAVDVKLRKISDAVLSKGTLNMTAVSPREVFRFAIREAAYGVVCLHNHPSGDVTPSAEDRRLTVALSMAGDSIGIKLLDHLVIGKGYYSFKEHDALRG